MYTHSCEFFKTQEQRKALTTRGQDCLAKYTSDLCANLARSSGYISGHFENILYLVQKIKIRKNVIINEQVLPEHVGLHHCLENEEVFISDQDKSR
jgi:hypothetical protein